MLVLIKKIRFISILFISNSRSQALLIGDDIELSFEVIFNLNYFGESHCTRLFFISYFNISKLSTGEAQNRKRLILGKCETNFWQMKN